MSVYLGETLILSSLLSVLTSPVELPHRSPWLGFGGAQGMPAPVQMVFWPQLCGTILEVRWPQSYVYSTYLIHIQTIIAS